MKTQHVSTEAPAGRPSLGGFCYQDRLVLVLQDILTSYSPGSHGLQEGVTGQRDVWFH